MAVALLFTGASYLSYLRRPGDAPISVRTVDWARDHGFDGVVDRVESWWYSRAPSGRRPPPTDLPPEVRGAAPGQWASVKGEPSASAAEEAWFQPDPRHPAVAVTVARIDQAATRAVYVPGLVEPAGHVTGWKGDVPTAARPELIATFNGGFRFRHIHGGAYHSGTELVPLVKNHASLVVRNDGRIEIGTWGRDLNMSPDVVSVRQNLAMIVEGGRAQPDLGIDRHGKYGSSRTQFQFTWRSGIGLDARGRLLYAAGHKVSLQELADALVKAGAVKAMQLDIHTGQVTFNWELHPGGRALHPRQLMPSMTRPSSRYLKPDQRDFVAILGR